VRLDLEVLELLRNEPELLAVADAIAATLALDAASLALVLRDQRRVRDDDAEIRDAS
jgi:hypothetical protein